MAYNVAHPWVQEFVERVRAERSEAQVEAYDSRGNVVIRGTDSSGAPVYFYVINHMSGTVFYNKLRGKVARGKVVGALDLLLGHKLGYY
jgi:hypothetical protein